MQAHNPGHVIINGRRVKVQRWQQLAGRIQLTVLVHGDQTGNELKQQLANESIALKVEDSPQLSVRPELTKHHVVGSGPTAVHRIEATLLLPEADGTEASIEARLDQIQQELTHLKAEIAELKSRRRPASVSQPTNLRQRLNTGQTMMDTEIDMNDLDTI